MAPDVADRALGITRRLLGERLAGLPDDRAVLGARIDALDLDSLTKLELVLELEDTFSLSLSETKIAACRTIGDLMDLVAGAAGGT